MSQQSSLDPAAIPFLKPHLVPEKYSYRCFVGQLPEERAFLFIRRHWIIELWLLVRFIFLLTMPFLIFAALHTWIPDWVSGARNSVALIIISIWMLFVGLKYYINWLDNFFDIVILSDRRIVDINQRNLFNRETTEASLAQIQDVKADVRGIFGTLMRYGDITIETAAEHSNFYLYTIAHPTTVASQILKIRYDYLGQRGGEGKSGEVEMSSEM